MKVVAENGKRYAVTGIALEPDVVVTSGMVTRFDNNKLYVIVEDRRERRARPRRGRPSYPLRLNLPVQRLPLGTRSRERQLSLRWKKSSKPLKAFAKASGGENVVLLGTPPGTNDGSTKVLSAP